METVKSSVECHHDSARDRSVKAKRREFAPLASFEDLEEFKPTKTSSAARNCLPVIEDCDTRPHESTKSAEGVGCATPPTVKSKRPENIRPIPIPVLDDTGSDNVTPPTPRIDISCASSSSTISDELPSSEKELRRYGLGLDCSEEQLEDLRSSTEEIAFEESAEGPLETKRLAIEALRRGSHPANLFSRKISTVTLGDNFTRKPSVYSLHTDALSPRTGRHSSFGGGASPRPKSCASSPTPTCRSGRRSVSPHLLMYETSFCGNRPTPVVLEPEIYAPEIITSQAEVHSTPVLVHHEPKSTQLQSSPSSPVPGPSSSTTSAFLKSMAALWPERFVVPNQPSLEDPDDESVEKVSPELSFATPVNCCAKDQSTDFSDKEAKDNISYDDDDEQPTGTSPPNELSTPLETKGLFLEETLDDDSNLPYVPTTLPLEKSVAVRIVPIKDRVGHFAPTTPIRRPRSTQPPNLTSLEDYISVNSHTETTKPEASPGKMKISLPKEESFGEDPPKSSKRELPTTWTNFAEMGLRNPRNLRRQVEDDFK